MNAWCRAASLILVALSAGGCLRTQAPALPRPQSPDRTPKPAAPLQAVDTATEQVVQRTLPSVVRVEVPGVALGSGVVITPRGDVVTNDHVVRGARVVLVSLFTGQQVTGVVEGEDPLDDIALVRIPPPRVPALPLMDSARLRPGQHVLAIGNPLGLRSTVTEGLVSAVHRTVQEPQGTYLFQTIQTSAAINPGNSGGALVTTDGHLAGIPTLTVVDPEVGGEAPGIGFAVPSNTVRRIATQLILYGRVIHSGRPWLGIAPVALSGSLARQLGSSAEAGVLVQTVVPGSPAQHAGLRPGDVVVAVRGRPVSSVGALVDTVGSAGVGTSLSLRVIRGSRSLTLQVVAGEMPVSTPSSAPTRLVGV